MVTVADRLRKVLSVLDFHSAVKALHRGDFEAASKLAERAISRTGTTYVQPHIVQLQIALAKGDLEQALMTRRHVDNAILKNPKFSEVTKNYLRYFVLRSFPDSALDAIGPTDIRDPAVTDIGAVSVAVRTRFGYSPPRATLATVLAPPGGFHPKT
jgi:hypothetical protein